MSEDYKRFVHQMWLKNCNERDAWAQPVLTKEVYESRNSAFLKDSFYTQEMGNKVWNGADYVNP